MTQSEQPPRKHQKNPEEQERVLRKVYFDILDGWTAAEVDGEEVCIKHFDLKTQTIVDTHYSKIYKKARENGLLNEEELLDRLVEDGTWSKKEEDDLKKREKSLEGLKATSTKALNEKMQEQIEANIEKAEQELQDARKKKQSLIVNTCEQFAERRSSDLIIRLSFYSTDKKTKFLSPEEFDMLDREDVGEMISVYNDCIKDINSGNIQQIAIEDFFTSYYQIVESNPQAFFDKKIHELTFFQINLLNYAKLFSSIFKNLDPPERIKKDAQRLLDFAKSEQKKREQEARKQKAKENSPSRMRR